MRRLKIKSTFKLISSRRLLSALISLSLVGCATYDPKAGTYTPESQPLTSGSGDLFVPLAVAATIYQFAYFSSGKEKLSGLSGKCIYDEAAAKLTESPCVGAYLLVTQLKTKHQSQIWLSEKGEFYFAGNNSEKYEVELIQPYKKLKSKKIVMTVPSSVEIKIL